MVKKYESEITRLSAQVEAGNSRAAEQLVDLIERIVRDAARSVGGINLIKLDRLEAEQAFLNTSQTEGTTLFENAAKQANDSIARTAIMAGYPVGVIYLQVVSLVALITTAIGMFASSKKFSGSKFFTLYLAGFVFLFLIAQFTATSVGGRVRVGHASAVHGREDIHNARHDCGKNHICFRGRSGNGVVFLRAVYPVRRIV